MTDEVLAALEVKKGEVVVDGTAGAGGHSEALAHAAKIKLISLDADPDAVAAVQKRLGKKGAVINANFGDLLAVAEKTGITFIDKALFDLGWNRGQLTAGRGFSFMYDEPLSMSYGPKARSGFTAAEMLNTFTEKALADIFFGYGEERYARRIAKVIVERREEKPLATTLELVELIKDSVPAAYRRGRLHPATRSFQGLRIAVNDELGALEQGIEAAWKLLAPGGRIAVITFHSIEDRAVKRLFAKFAKGGGGEKGRLLYKKPLVASAAEIKRNPPSRSAKLRAIEKICPQE
ncbi:MAG: rsmH [Candidatus Adlerbacteria bacterium]|nr:rsmH [Candidatus Adlerbacteria bacterium]